MANKRGAGADPMSMSGAPGKSGSSRKGASGAAKGRTTGAMKASGATGETASTGKTTTKRSTATGTGNGRARRSTSAASTGTTRSSRGGQKSAASLKKDLRDFAGARPDGWSHEDWLHFLDDLKSRGHNINDRDAIGSMLERERLALALERIPGVGPQRVKSIADKYGYLWRLRETDADQLAREANVPKAVAEKVLNGLRH